MPAEISLTLTPEQASDSTKYTQIAASQLGVAVEKIALARILGRSIDARSRNIKVNLTVQLFLNTEQLPEKAEFKYPNVADSKHTVVVVGAGPAGLFAALRLVELGVKPILIERGKDVSARKRDIATVSRGGAVDPDSNYAFGEGGAGAYSDGKLYTRSKKRGDFRKILELLHFFGADESVLYDAQPHIGTDKLPGIIAKIREQIIASGGEVRFQTKMKEVIIKSNKVSGVVTDTGETIEGKAVVLATGHSARDVYQMLHEKGVKLEAKNFAMGVRVEHPQTLIDTMQYHLPERGKYLPSAAYRLVSQVNGRGVYSFCMCPGGFIVPAMTADDEAVVNGMSPSDRGSKYANAGIVTEIRAEDYSHLEAEYGVLAGLKFQEQFEQLARRNGDNERRVPAQRLVDFVQRRKSKDLPSTSYAPGIVSSDFNAWLPKFIIDALRGGFQSFGMKMRGFVTNDAVILGVESRTSSPIRVPRDRDTFQHVEIEGLYPCGEGAGYAGGIVSSAVDGELSAEAIFKTIN